MYTRQQNPPQSITPQKLGVKIDELWRALYLSRNTEDLSAALCSWQQELSSEPFQCVPYTISLRLLVDGVMDYEVYRRLVNIGGLDIWQNSSGIAARRDMVRSHINVDGLPDYPIPQAATRFTFEHFYDMDTKTTDLRIFFPYPDYCDLWGFAFWKLGIDAIGEKCERDGESQINYAKEHQDSDLYEG